MAGVQFQAPALNDENSTLQGPAQFKPVGPLQPSKQQGSVLKSARKAFGNITNNTQASASKSKQAPPAAAPRRAFGDITNSAAKPPAGSAAAATAKKAAGALRPAAAAPTSLPQHGLHSAAAAPAPSSSQVVSAGTQVEAAPSSRQWWEGLEPERPAGKTWEQLEAEREAAMEADALQSADEIWAAVGAQCMFAALVPVAAHDSSDDDDSSCIAPVPSSCVREQPLVKLPDMSLEDLTFPGGFDLASLLPDIPSPSQHEDQGDEAVLPDAAAAAADADAQEATGACPAAGAAVSPLAAGLEQPAEHCRSPDVTPW